MKFRNWLMGVALCLPVFNACAELQTGEDPVINHRWNFLPHYSDDQKFVFGLPTDNQGSLLLTCDRRANALTLMFGLNGKYYPAHDIDSIMAYSPDGTLRDSIVVHEGPPVTKFVQFFDETTSYSVMLRSKIYGRYTVAARASGDLGANMEVCRDLPFRYD